MGMQYKADEFDIVYPDGAVQQNAVASFMNRVEGQVVRTTPTTDITDDERVLRAKLVLEEALEFVEAMGCLVFFEETNTAFLPTALTAIGGPNRIDLPAAADAIADITYVVEGSACTLGIDSLAVFSEVHRSNMEKLHGPIREDGKQLKPEGWQPPQIEQELRNQGWNGC